MPHPDHKCATSQCPLVPLLDRQREEIELYLRVLDIMAENTKAMAEMITMRGCPADICAIAREGKKS